MTEVRLPLAELLAKAGDGDFLRSVAEAVVQLLMETDVEGLIGAGRHERSGERTTYRNGYRDRVLGTRLGSLQLRIPKLRQGSYFPPFLEPRKTSEKALVAVLQASCAADRAAVGLDAARRRPGAGDGAGWDQQEHRQQAVQGYRRPRRRLPRPSTCRRLALSVAGCDLPQTARGRGRPHRVGAGDDPLAAEVIAQERDGVITQRQAEMAVVLHHLTTGGHRPERHRRLVGLRHGGCFQGRGGGEQR